MNALCSEWPWNTYRLAISSWIRIHFIQQLYVQVSLYVWPHRIFKPLACQEYPSPATPWLVVLMHTDSVECLAIRICASVAPCLPVYITIRPYHGQTFCVIVPFVWGVHRSSVGFPHNWSVMWIFVVSLLLVFSKLPDKQFSDRWIDTPWLSCDGTVLHESYGTISYALLSVLNE